MDDLPIHLNYADAETHRPDSMWAWLSRLSLAWAILATTGLTFFVVLVLTTSIEPIWSGVDWPTITPQGVTVVILLQPLLLMGVVTGSLWLATVAFTIRRSRATRLPAAYAVVSGAMGLVWVGAIVALATHGEVVVPGTGRPWSLRYFAFDWSSVAEATLLWAVAALPAIVWATWAGVRHLKG